MPNRPQYIAFDVMETLFDLRPLSARLEAVGLSGSSLPLWFSRSLRDGFALAAAEIFQPFGPVAMAALRELAADAGHSLSDAEVTSVVKGFAELPAHADVAAAFRAARSAGVGVATLANGSAEVMRTLVRGAGVEDLVDHVISIDDVRHWKPRREVYLHAAKVVGAPPDRLALVAAHPWDLQGAKKAGLTTGWVRRKPGPFNAVMDVPDAEGTSLPDVVGKLLAMGN